MEQKRRRFGLVGKELKHSFSPTYFAQKFEQFGINDASYELFSFAAISDFPIWLRQQKNLVGLNVTIPYKQVIMPYLDSLSPAAQAIGAVNTIAFRNNLLIGHNTDIWGFEQSLLACLTQQQRASRALILGTGGAALAVSYVLQQLQIPYQFVSRKPTAVQLGYEQMDATVLQQHLVLINTTPLGMYPHLQTLPDLDYGAITPQHLLFDLVYNPAVTAFLQQGKNQGATIQNGLPMLQGQADKSWEIWNENT